MSPLPTISLIGEAMLELSRDSEGNTRLAYGGDTLNTAIYLVRLGIPASYITALGNDPYSNEMIAEWGKEGLERGSVLRHPYRLPGLYAIETSPEGERNFYYWRSNSAARDFFSLEGHAAALDKAAHTDWLYISGITLSIFDNEGRAELDKLAARVRAAGGQVVFDPNYRSSGWPSPVDAKQVMDAFCRHATLVLPTIDDEHALSGRHTESEHAAHWHSLGVETVIMKHGPEGATIHMQGVAPVHVPVPETVEAIDTTGAGDSFNAALIAGLMRGYALPEAVIAGHRLAGVAVRHRGAIIPVETMPTLL